MNQPNMTDESEMLLIVQNLVYLSKINDFDNQLSRFVHLGEEG